jgi:DNA recombination protein RmuC
MTTALLILAAVAAGALVAGAAFYLVFFSSQKNEDARREQYKQELRQLLELAEQKFETERVKQRSELDERRQGVESAVAQLTEQLKDYRGTMEKFEAERRQKYGSLEQSLKDAAENTTKLAATTEGLRALLDNSRARGQWGERMADDILRASGLQENVQYLKNRAQESSATRPDFTFLLPDDHRLHMDVKFPLDNYLRMSAAKSEDERARFKADFLKDVKNRIKEIQKRDYINPAEKTLDYVLLFIPNEQVYGFVQEALPGLIDESLAQKVVLCSPFTLYAVLSVVRQAFDNFFFAQRTQEVLKLITTFASAYERFRERFADLGEKLSKTTDLYHDISDKSFRQLESAVQKIEKVRKGQEDEALDASAAPLPLPKPKEPAKPRE